MQIVRRAKLYNFLKSLATNYIIKASVWPFFSVQIPLPWLVL